LPDVACRPGGFFAGLIAGFFAGSFASLVAGFFAATAPPGTAFLRTAGFAARRGGRFALVPTFAFLLVAMCRPPVVARRARADVSRDPTPESLPLPAPGKGPACRGAGPPGVRARVTLGSRPATSHSGNPMTATPFDWLTAWWTAPARLAPESLRQVINPWSFWTQQGFINVNLMQSSDPDMERDIVENVAGYGLQLGRIGEALRVLLDHGAVSEAALSPEERKAVQDFTALSDQIADLKAKREQFTARQVDGFVATLARLREKNPENFRYVADRLRAALG